jgi:DNA-binding response OmpR family regulator
MMEENGTLVAEDIPREAGEDASGHQKMVLIAEDSPGVIDLLQLILADAGFGTAVAMDGQEAITKSREVRPDLILLDIMLPVMDGWEVATRILTDRRTADIPIIFLTARAGIQEQLRGWRMPIFEYITKPFEIDDLLQKVEAVLSTEPEQRPELRERLRREKLRALLGMGANSGEDDPGQGR